MTLDIADIMQTWREKLLREIKVSLPGYITKYNDVTRQATIQLNIKPELNRQFVDPPILNNIPIRQYNAPAVLFYAPPAVGAPVDVIFADFSLSEYQDSDGTSIIEPEDTTKHGLNNAYAVLAPQSAKNQHRIDDPTLPGIYLQDDAKLFLGRLGGGEEEVLNLVNQVANALTDLANYIKTEITFTHSPGSPSGPPTNAALLEPILEQLTQASAGLQSLGDIKET